MKERGKKGKKKFMCHMARVTCCVSAVGCHLWPLTCQWHQQPQTPLLVLLTKKTSLLCRLHAQTLPDATPSVSKIHPFSKIAFEPIQQFWYPSGYKISEKMFDLWLEAPFLTILAWRHRKDTLTKVLMNKWINEWRRYLQSSPWLCLGLLKILSELGNAKKYLVFWSVDYNMTKI